MEECYNLNDIKKVTAHLQSSYCFTMLSYSDVVRLGFEDLYHTDYSTMEITTDKYKVFKGSTQHGEILLAIKYDSSNDMISECVVRGLKFNNVNQLRGYIYAYGSEYKFNNDSPFTSEYTYIFQQEPVLVEDEATKESYYTTNQLEVNRNIVKGISYYDIKFESIIF